MRTPPAGDWAGFHTETLVKVGPLIEPTQLWLHRASVLATALPFIYVFVVDGSWFWETLAILWVQAGLMLALRAARLRYGIRLWLLVPVSGASVLRDCGGVARDHTPEYAPGASVVLPRAHRGVQEARHFWRTFALSIRDLYLVAGTRNQRDPCITCIEI